MPFPFGKSQKSPAEIVKNLKENMAYMEKLDATESKKCEKVSVFFFAVCAVVQSAVVKTRSRGDSPTVYSCYSGCGGGFEESVFSERGAVWHR